MAKMVAAGMLGLVLGLALTVSADPTHPYRRFGGALNNFFEHDVYVGGRASVAGTLSGWDGGPLEIASALQLDQGAFVDGGLQVAGGVNYLGADQGVANHIIVACPGPVAGTQVCVKLTHAMGAGTADTVTCNPLPDGGPPGATLPLRSHLNVANGLATALGTGSVHDRRRRRVAGRRGIARPRARGV
jgi:hypothetical protein